MNPSALEIVLSVAGALLSLIVLILGYLGSKALDRIDKAETDRAALSERIAKIEILGVGEKLEKLTSFMSEIRSKLDVLVALGERERDHERDQKDSR